LHLILDALNSPKWYHRRNVAIALGLIGDVRAIPALCEAVNNQNPQDNAYTDIVDEIFNALKTLKAVDSLIELTSSADPWARFLAVRTLGELKDKRAVGTLNKIITSHTDLSLRERAQDALYEIGASSKLSLSGSRSQLNEKLMNAVKRGDLKAATVAISEGADPNFGGNIDYTVLIFAAVQGNVEVIDLLLTHGADVNKRYNSRTPLHLAASHSQAGSINALIRGGADINALDENGSTALMWAAHKGCKDIVESLLKAGANAHIKSYVNTTAMDSAKDYPEITALLQRFLK
jgi:HEAT repeat protein